MIRKYKSIKILDKPLGKLKKNDKKLTPDDFINSKNYYIVKSFVPLKLVKKNDYILYTLYNKYNRYLGSAHVYFSEIDDINNIGNAHVQIIQSYQRKGLASFLYDYIEKDLKIKLKISSDPSKDAKAFWKNRLKTRAIIKKKNPTDLAFLRLITIVKNSTPYDHKCHLITYHISFRNKVIGYVEIFSNKNYIEDIEIGSEFRRKGLATYLYNYIEKDLGRFLRPSSDQLLDGKLFWKNRFNKPWW